MHGMQSNQGGAMGMTGMMGAHTMPPIPPGNGNVSQQQHQIGNVGGMGSMAQGMMQQMQQSRGSGVMRFPPHQQGGSGVTNPGMSQSAPPQMPQQHGMAHQSFRGGDSYNSVVGGGAGGGSSPSSSAQQAQQRLIQMQLQAQQQQLQMQQQQLQKQLQAHNEQQQKQARVDQFHQLQAKAAKLQRQQSSDQPLQNQVAEQRRLSQQELQMKLSQQLQMQQLQKQLQSQKGHQNQQQQSMSSPKQRRASSSQSSPTLPSKASRDQTSLSSVSGTGGGEPSSGGALSSELTQQLLSQCDWQDRTVYVARQFLGGTTVNGFMKATAAVQRIKKQRARQVAATNAKQEQKAALQAQQNASTASGDFLPPGDPSLGLSNPIAPQTGGGKGKRASGSSLPGTQEAEEELKNEIMTGRTAKKIRTELLQGVDFCKHLSGVIHSVLAEIDPTWNASNKDGLLGGEEAQSSSTNSISTQSGAAGNVLQTHNMMPGMLPLSGGGNRKNTIPDPHGSARPDSLASTAVGGGVTERVTMAEMVRRRSSGSLGQSSSHPNASPGDPSGSTLRRLRKRKAVASDAKDSQSLDDSALLFGNEEFHKRKPSKKEIMYRSFEVTRFRALQKGDYVAARLDSRDLWILARVVTEYPKLDLSPVELLSMTEAKRDSLFKNKVLVQDIEDDAQKAKSVARQLVLPLPRTYNEAAEWGARCKKGTRVYAMFPSTTSLYCGTVVDNTTFCRGDDDIIVVEFDGDEKDQGGALPQHHIPARFVTLIPREFPSAQTTKKKRNSPAISSTTESESPEPTTSKAKRGSAVRERKSSGTNKAKGSADHKPGVSDDTLNDMLSEMAYDFGETDELNNFEKMDNSPSGGSRSGRGPTNTNKKIPKKKSTSSSFIPSDPGQVAVSGSAPIKKGSTLQSLGGVTPQARGRNPKAKQSAADHKEKTADTSADIDAEVEFDISEEDLFDIMGPSELPTPEKRAKREPGKSRKKKATPSATKNQVGAPKASKKRGSGVLEQDGNKNEKK